MKDFIFFFIVLIVKVGSAQQGKISAKFTGIYMTAEDFKNNKLSYSINCDSSSEKIKLHNFFTKKYIDVIRGDKKIRLYKDSIFGYRDCQQMAFRYFNGTEYQIKENQSIVIYTADEQVYSTTGKTFVVKPACFFSNGLNGQVLPLTVLNLKRAFPGNLKFHDMLDMEFGDKTLLSLFDNEHNTYKVNYLLNQSTNSN